MGKFIIGLIIGILLVPFGFWVYVRSGSAPVAVADPQMPFEHYFAKTAEHARINRDMQKCPIAADESAYLAGAQIYKENCAECHGYVNKKMTPGSMFPIPPQLLQGKGVTDNPPGETFWKVQNGIRLSGMPAFSDRLSTDQMWQVSLLLANANKLPDSATQALTYTPPAPAVSDPGEAVDKK
ncbi:MAG: c-type cytochrome [Terriglobia bacterium]